MSPTLPQGVSEPYKHTIRAFLVHFHTQILRHSTERFNFRSGSVGNFFFAGARIFFRSLEAAIFLFSRVARIPEGSLVLPSICAEEHITLAAELADGSVICGQNDISHPCSGGEGGAALPRGGQRSKELLFLRELEKDNQPSLLLLLGTDASRSAPRPRPPPCAAPAASPQAVDKAGMACPLPSPVRRIFYMSAEGERQEHEVAPGPNPRVLTELAKADAVVYGMGSLYTSIVPSLILKGMGECIAGRDCPKVGAYQVIIWWLPARQAGRAATTQHLAWAAGKALLSHLFRPLNPHRPQVLVLNGGLDREISACQGHPGPMTASDLVRAIADALNRRHSKKTAQLEHPAAAYVSAVIVPAGSPIRVDASALRALGVATIVEVPASLSAQGVALYEPNALVAAIGQIVRDQHRPS